MINPSIKGGFIKIDPLLYMFLLVIKRNSNPNLFKPTKAAGCDYYKETSVKKERENRGKAGYGTTVQIKVKNCFKAQLLT